MRRADAMILPSTLDLAAATDLLTAVRAALQANPSLQMNASQVETLTLPCAQILASAMRFGAVRIDHRSAAFAAAWADLGLDSVSHCEAAPDVSARESAAEPVTERTSPKRIMTIDDSKTMRDMLMLTLKSAGYEVMQGVDGQNGLDVLGDTPVDVVITDINMPVMDGYDVIRNLRRNPTHAATPILVLTTEADIEKRSLAREAGATGWMVKPFDPREADRNCSKSVTLGGCAGRGQDHDDS